MIARRLATLALAALFVAVGAAAPARAASTPAIAAFESAFASINDYTFSLRSTSRRGLGQDRVYAYSFMKRTSRRRDPAGKTAAARAVAGRVATRSAVTRGFLGYPRRSASTTVRDRARHTIPDGLLQNIVALYATALKLTQRAGASTASDHDGRTQPSTGVDERRTLLAHFERDASAGPQILYAAARRSSTSR